MEWITDPVANNRRWREGVPACADNQGKDNGKGKNTEDRHDRDKENAAKNGSRGHAGDKQDCELCDWYCWRIGLAAGHPSFSGTTTARF